MKPVVLSIQVGLPKAYSHAGKPDSQESTWTSGIFKSEVRGPVYVSEDGLTGDGQADLKHHGGPDRVLLLFSKSNYSQFEDLIGEQIPHGGFGENLTVDQFSEAEVCVGDTYQIGEAIIEISQPRIPCFKLGRRLAAPEIVRGVLERRAGGSYARILRPGHIEAGNTLERLTRPYPSWTIVHALDVFLDSHQPQRAELGSLPEISELWRTRLLH